MGYDIDIYHIYILITYNSILNPHCTIDQQFSTVNGPMDKCEEMPSWHIEFDDLPTKNVGFQSYIWLVVWTPLKHMSSSVGVTIPNIWKDKSHVPNHQPVYVSLLEDDGNIIQLKFVVKFLHAFEVINWDTLRIVVPCNPTTNHEHVFRDGSSTMFS